VHPSSSRPGLDTAHGDGVVLVTGATGLLGSDLVRRWTTSAAPHRVAVLVRDLARWDAIARRLALPTDAVVALEGTIVCYASNRLACVVLQTLLAHGAAPGRTAAMIYHGTQPSQATTTGTLTRERSPQALQRSTSVAPLSVRPTISVR